MQDRNRVETDLVDVAWMIVDNPPVPFIKYHVVHLSHQSAATNTVTQQAPLQHPQMPPLLQ